MTRLYDWQLRLETFVRQRQHMAFAWGLNDCALFAADAVEAMTGARLLPHMRGYHSGRDALRLIEHAGGLRAIGCHALGGFVSAKLAKVGDVVLVNNAAREALAICNGTSAIGPGDGGIAAVPMRDALVAWRVG